MIVAVASGKGGTGKTTVATNLAASLISDMPVQILDCDVEEPNCHLFLHPVIRESEEVSLPVPVVDEDACNLCGKCVDICAFNAIARLGDKILTFPELCHGCGGCALLCPEKAISEIPRKLGQVDCGNAGKIQFSQGKLSIGSPLAPPVIKAVKRKASYQGAVIVDAPPGTSCPVVAAVMKTDFCLLVTEPTPFGLNDLQLAVGLVKKLGIDCGVVVNRSGSGDEMIERYCRQESIPVLLKIPFERDFAACYAQGRLIVEEFPQWRLRFRNLWREIEKRVGDE